MGDAMSYEARLRNLMSTNDLAVTLAKVGLVASVLLLGLVFVTSQPFVVLIPLSTGTACSLYLLTYNRRVRHVDLPRLPGLVSGYLPSLVVAGLAGYVWLIWRAGGRTLPAFLLAGAVGAAILVQVLLVDDERLLPGLLLGQILLASLAVRYGALLGTPGYVGVDIWTHAPVFVQNIVDAGSLAPLADVKYVMAPIYHLFGAMGTLVFGAPRPAIYLTLGLIVPLSAVFVYGGARQFVPVRWALLATALYVFADQFIRWGIHVIPTSLGLVFFLALVYFVTRLFTTGPRPWILALALLSSVAVVFTHQVSTAIMLVFLGVAAAVAVVGEVARGWPTARSSSGTAVGIVGLFVLNLALTVVAWANTPVAGEFVFLWRMLGAAIRLISEQAGFLNLAGGGTAPATDPTLLEVVLPYVELIGFALLLAAAVVGGLVMLRWETPSGASVTYIVTAGLLFVAVFGLSFFGIRFLLPGRWMAFLYAFLVIIAAVGLHHVYQTASRPVIVAVVLVLALAYPTTMVIAEDASYDASAIEDHHTRFSYTAAEIGAVETISEIRPPSVEDRIHSDHPYRTLFIRVGGYSGGILGVGPDGPVTSSPIVARDYQQSGAAKFRSPDDPPQVAYQRSVAATSVCRPERNVVYANSQVRLCLSTSWSTEVAS